MSNFLITLRMEFRGQFGLGKNPSKKAWGVFALNLIFDAVIYCVFLLAMYFVSKMILTGSVPMQYEFLVVATAASMLVQLFTSTGNLIKVLYYDVDNELLMRFPIDGMELFLAKATFVFLNNLIISFVFTLPFYVYYGVFTHAAAGHYVGSVAAALFISFIPFFIANLIAVPVMHLNNLIRNKFGLKLTFIILLMIFAFSIYMLLLRGILEYYKTSEASVLFSEGFLLKIKSIARSFVPASFFANVFYGDKPGLNVLFIALFTLGIGAVSLLLSRKSYYSTLLKSLEKGREAFTKKTKNKIRSQFATVFVNELKAIFRSFNYSFQYLAMAIAAPLMVYFCNNLAVAVGDSAVGGGIIPGLTLMVILIFDTIIVSFASTTVSRNGATFYLTKIIPVPYKLQMFSKMVLYFTVAGGSSLLSCLVTWAVFGGEKYGNYVGIVDVVSIFAISALVIISQTCVAIMSDMKSPTFDVNGEGELTQANKNVSNSMILGIVIAVLYGLIAMIFTYLPIGIFKAGIDAVYVLLSCVSLVMTAVILTVFFLTVDKKYDKIVP